VSVAARGAATWPAAVAVAALLAGCATLVATPPAPAATRPAISLSVRYDDGARHVRTGHLTCNARVKRATGALAGRVAAARQCVRVRAIASLLTHAPPARRICTQLYGGPQTLRVSGRLGTAAVQRRFKRTDGCEIRDFARVLHALPIVARIS
jgi:hypothetical protein